MLYKNCRSKKLKEFTFFKNKIGVYNKLLIFINKEKEKL